MWTRLIYLSLNQAFTSKKVNNIWRSPALSGRYRNQLAKEFKKVGLPLLMIPPKDDKKNPRHKMPKGHKIDNVVNKLRYENIKHNLAKAEDNILKFRQENINNRRYRGLDRFMKETLPDLYQVSKDVQSGSVTVSKSKIKHFVKNEKEKEE